MYYSNSDLESQAVLFISFICTFLQLQEWGLHSKVPGPTISFKKRIESKKKRTRGGGGGGRGAISMETKRGILP